MSDKNIFVGPAIAGAIVFGYEYFQNRNTYIMNHLKVAGLAVATSAGSGMIFQMLPLPEMVEMVAQPGLSGVAFAFGRKQFLGTRNTLIKDIAEGAVADLAGGFAGKAVGGYW
jgi:hypothetical protein